MVKKINSKKGNARPELFRLKNKRPNSKLAIAMSFNWIFAIIAGGFILFIAIYTAGKLMGMFETKSTTETAKEISTLFDPLEAGIAAGKSQQVPMQKQTRVFFYCDETLNPPFGEQHVSISENSLGTRWTDENDMIKTPIKDKYIFTENVNQGKIFYMFSMPFSLPYRVADISLFTSNKYCFYDTPTQVRDDIEGLNINIVEFPNSTKDKCEGLKVCFGGTSKCDIKVDINQKYVLKNGTKLYYYDTLLYGAIFSSPQIYDCNVKRLGAKMNELSKVYMDKAKIIERSNCDAKIVDKIANVMIGAKNITNSKNILTLGTLADEINSINIAGNSGCRLY